MSNKINVVNDAQKDLKIVVTRIDDEMQIIIGLNSEKIELNKVKPGQVFKGNCGTEFILLEFTQSGDACVLRKELLLDQMQFGDNNNFDGSLIDKYLGDTYSKELDIEFSLANVIEQELDLISMDGLTDYGKIKRNISLLPFATYRRCRKAIGENLDDRWWLLDADSTGSGRSTSYVQCVFSSGGVGYGCGWGGCGVRPFLILKSSIFVSLVETKS